MKNLFKVLSMVIAMAIITVSCNEEQSEPEPEKTSAVITGETSYEASVNTTVTISVNVKADSLTSVTANEEMVTFTQAAEQTVTFDYTIPQDARVGEELKVNFKAVTPDQTAEFEVMVKPIGELSKVDNFLELTSAFANVDITVLLSSSDQLAASPEFVYGSMADGAGLLKNTDGSYTLINNIEADYSIARITLDSDLRPFSGEYILNATATAFTAQCSGSMINPEEHGFGPLYLSGGEWGGSSKGVFATDPFRSPEDASSPTMLPALGQWSTENAVVIGKDAYADKTIAFIGDDHSNNEIPSGQLGMYVGNRGDLESGKLYGLKVTSEGVIYEMDMEEGKSYDMEFVELEETDIDMLDAEAKNKGVMGFSRLEDIDWRRGSASNQRELYFAVTGRQKDGLIGKGAVYGRIYKVELNENDPTKAGKITCVLDGDKLDGKAKEFSSPDNILVTENFAYIQEDPNGYFDTPEKTHYARIYQYNLTTGELKVVLECGQVAAAAAKIGVADRIWEITGMIDVSDITGKDETFIVITQNHGWEPEDGSAFTDPKANPSEDSRKEGSQLYLIEGLSR